jgi:hypothetical protein
MSSNPKQAAEAATSDLAARIFIELVCRNIVVTDGAAQIKSDPGNLAKISYKLADVFERVTLDVRSSSAPKNQSFEVQSADLANWGTPKT